MFLKAWECEAAKHGEITLAICTHVKEISTNLTYEGSGDNFDDSASEDFKTWPVVASTSSTIPDNDAMDLDWTANNVGQLLNPLVVNWEVFTLPHLIRVDSTQTLRLCSDSLRLCLDFFWLRFLPNWDVQSKLILVKSEQLLGLISDCPYLIIEKSNGWSKDWTLKLMLLTW